MSQERIAVLAIRWLILAAAVWLAAEIVSGIELEGWGSTLAVALILGLLNLYVRPIIVMLSLPVTIFTMGLFLVVINALLLLLADWISNVSDDIRFDVDGFGSALLGAVIISLVSWVISMFVNAQRIGRGITRGW